MRVVGGGAPVIFDHGQVQRLGETTGSWVEWVSEPTGTANC
jgi:hypothetical protein